MDEHLAGVAERGAHPGRFDEGEPEEIFGTSTRAGNAWGDSQKSCGARQTSGCNHKR